MLSLYFVCILIKRLKKYGHENFHKTKLWVLLTSAQCCQAIRMALEKENLWLNPSPDLIIVYMLSAWAHFACLLLWLREGLDQILWQIHFKTKQQKTVKSNEKQLICCSSLERARLTIFVIHTRFAMRPTHKYELKILQLFHPVFLGVFTLKRTNPGETSYILFSKNMKSLKSLQAQTAMAA